MDRTNATQSPSLRLKKGDALLAKAQVVDTKPLEARLNAFAATHRSYGEAQAKVDEVDAQLRAAVIRLAQLDADQDDAVEALALCLANEGEPRGNPFASFNAEAPGRLKALAVADEAREIHTLVAAVLRGKSLAQATRDAAQAAEQAALQVEAALPPLEALRGNLNAARQQRDAIAHSWDTDFSNLRRWTRATADIEAPGLYTKLFGTRTTRKAKPDTTPPTAENPPTPPAA